MARPIRTCAVDGCNGDAAKPGSGRGWCGKHYQRFRKHGDPLVSLLDRETTPGTPCAVDGCERPKYARGLCTKHYTRFRATGSTEGGESREQWLKRHALYEGNNCLVWPFSHASHGRGIVRFDGELRSAPNVMCHLAHGKPPTINHEAAHSCGNGHRGCINPRHLRWATRKENERDKAFHGTLRRGEAVNTAKLTPELVKAIRESSDSAPQLARVLGVTRNAIYAIRRRKTWKHVI